MKTFFAKVWAFLAANKRQVAIFALLTAGFAVKRWVPVEKELIAYIDMLLIALGFAALATPAFTRGSSDEDPS